MEPAGSSGRYSCLVSHMPRRPQATVLTILEFGAIGDELAYAIGMAQARPDMPVVPLDGDGSPPMHGQELETIRRPGLDVPIRNLGGGACGSGIHERRDDGLPVDAAASGRIGLAAIARGLGIGGTRVEDPGALPGLVVASAAAGGAAPWDSPVSDPVAAPGIRRARSGGHRGTGAPGH